MFAVGLRRDETAATDVEQRNEIDRKALPAFELDAGEGSEHETETLSPIEEMPGGYLVRGVASAVV